MTELAYAMTRGRADANEMLNSTRAPSVDPHPLLKPVFHRQGVYRRGISAGRMTLRRKYTHLDLTVALATCLLAADAYRLDPF
jgi:hypothetical protein